MSKWGGYGGALGQLPGHYGRSHSPYGAITPTPSDRVVSAAEYQVEQAKAGRRLTDYRQVKFKERGFLNPSVDTAWAYLKTAFWVAAAAQILSDMALAEEADKLLSAGKWRTRLHMAMSSDDPIEIGRIHKRGADAIQLRAGSRRTEPSMKAILTTLGTTADPERVQATQAIEEAKIPAVAAGRAAMEAAEGFTSVVEAGKGILEERPWWFWPAVAGGGLAVLGILAVATSPGRAASQYAYRQARARYPR